MSSSSLDVRLDDDSAAMLDIVLKFVDGRDDVELSLPKGYSVRDCKKVLYTVDSDTVSPLWQQWSLGSAELPDAETLSQLGAPQALCPRPFLCSSSSLFRRRRWSGRGGTVP